MTATFWLTVGQIVILLAVSGYASWFARIIAEAADSSAQAAERATKAAEDAERIAADMGEIRDLLREWLDRQEARVSYLREERTRVTAMAIRPVRTDTAEAQAVITPHAIVGPGAGMRSAGSTLDVAARPGRGRHARDTAPRWAAALRETASRATSRIKS